MANSFMSSRKACRILCAGFLMFILAADICLAGHTNNIMLTGYWPPTNEMLRKFSTDPNKNPGGWQGQNWEGRGYNIYAYFPEFPGGTGSNPKGNGDFEIDYQDVGSWSPPAAPTGDFWRLTGTVHPVAIMSFGQGTGPWEIEFNARNLPSATWSNDYLSPLKPTPAPPDTTQSSGYVRHSSLPVEAIAEAVNGSGLGINAWVDWDVDPGHFLCEYMAYHDAWYQNLHSDPCDQYYCVAAGFTHLAAGVSPANGTIGVEAALRALIKNLDSQLIQYTISGTVMAGGSPLNGVTMCGLPGNPITNSSGVYTAQVGGGWSGVVTPLKSGYAFTQKTYSNVIANQSAQDYTASAAAADTIVFDAASNTSSSTAGTTLSWSHTIGSGNNRVLVVGVVTEDSIAANQIISSVKFNNVIMTPISGSTKSRTVYSSSSYSSTLRTDLYYMLNPPIGAYTVLVTYNGSVSYRIGGAISLRNVKQQIPEAVIANSATSASISTNIDVPNAGAWVVDIAGHSNSGSFTSSTTTERWDKNSGYNTGASGSKAVTTPGLNTITWTFSGSSGAIVYSLAAFAPSETVLVPTRTLTTSTTAGGTVTTPGIGNFTYSDGNTVSIVASANANYHFVNWTGTAVTAGKVANANAASTTVLMDANYTVMANFAIDQKTISGHVAEPDANIPVEGVSIDATSGGGSDTTDVNGFYHLTVNYGWSGTVTPSKTGYTFEPNSIVYNNVTTDQSNDDYTAILDTFTISGYAVDSAFAPLAGVLAVPDNNGGSYTSKYYGGGSDTTDANGYYEVLVDYNWSGNVVSSKYAYTFEPNSIGYANVTADIAEQNYVGTLLTYKITGYVKNSCEVAIKNVTVDANNGGGSDTTDTNGYYEVWVGYNWSGAVTLSKAHYTFDPNGRTYSGVIGDETGQDYAANNIYDLDCSGYIGFGDVKVIGDNWLLSGSGDFNGDNNVNFLDFAEFGIIWQDR